jgi:4-amino-4-deoxy-L-arabinose transferase-like glycosyltransferase
MFVSQRLEGSGEPTRRPGAPSAWPEKTASWRVYAGIAVILLLHAGLLADASVRNFVTVDEAGHLVAGISHWTTGTYSMYRVNPPLPRMLAAAPVFLLHPDMQGIQPVNGLAERAEWPSANRFAFDNAARYREILVLARLAGILWSCLGGWLLYRWGSELYGCGAGLLAMALWCFDPNVLAHAQLNTPDVPAAVAGLGACYCFWRYLRRPSWSSALLAGIVLGVAQLTKFTLLYLYALWPLLWAVDRLRARVARQPTLPLWSQAAQGLGMVVISLLVINLGYEFQDTCKPLGSYVFVSRALRGEPDPDRSGDLGSVNRFQDSWVAALPVPLPAEYLSGIDRQRYDFEHGWYSYLRGEWKYGGWWYYYLYGLGVKSPLGVLALVGWGLGLALLGYPRRGRLVDELFVWFPVAAVLALVSSQTGFNHHVRYVLPVLPFAFLGAGRVACFLSRRHWKAGLLVSLLLAWSIGGTLAIRPHYLSYFNEAAGGPDNGHAHLIDSNIDWGQDLLYLKAWLDQHPEARPLGLAHFNPVDPRVVGIDFTFPPSGPNAGCTGPDCQAGRGPRPGWFALDVNFVRGYTFHPANGRGSFRNVSMHEYEYFQHFQPIAKAGYSIFIYHITREDANRFRRERGLPLLDDQEPASKEVP